MFQPELSVLAAGSVVPPAANVAVTPTSEALPLPVLATVLPVPVLASAGLLLKFHCASVAGSPPPVVTDKVASALVTLPKELATTTE